MTQSPPTAWTTGLSRRRALSGAVGLAAGLASSRLAGAQDSTPVVPEETDAGERIFTMFVQTAQAGGFRPKPGEEGVYQVVLQGISAQTVYFSDRPHRIVGAVSTADFLAGLGFSGDNPPNAAIVTQTEDGDEDVLVVELIDPQYDSGSQTLTYDVVVLDEYTGDGFGDLAQRQDDDALPETFGHTSLFIDDCPDVTQCWSAEHGVVGPFPDAPIPMCWDIGLCSPCENRSRVWLGERCHTQYGDRCGQDWLGIWRCTGI